MSLEDLFLEVYKQTCQFQLVVTEQYGTVIYKAKYYSFRDDTDKEMIATSAEKVLRMVLETK